MDRRVVDTVLELAGASRHGVVVQDDEGCVIWCNAAAAALLERPMDEMIGQRGLASPTVFCDADGTPLDIRSLPTRAVLGGLPHAEAVVGMRTGEHGGVSRWLEIDTHRVSGGEDGTEVLVVSSLIDISDRFETHPDTAAALRAFRLSLAPADVPQQPGFEIAARCRPASGTLIGGGDFFDVVELDNGGIAFFVGDMEGHGIGPATDTLLARHTLRAAARHAGDPAAALDWLGEALRTSSTQRSCTAVFGTAMMTATGVRVLFSLAGHPPPLWIDEQALAATVGSGGSIAGAVDVTDVPINEVMLDAGSALVFYTDGLTDAGSPRLSENELVAAARWCPTADALLDSLMNLNSPGDAGFSDDAAALVILVPGAHVQ